MIAVGERYRARFAELSAGGPVVAWNGEAAFTPLWGFRRRIPALVWLSAMFPALGVALAARVSLAAGFLVPTVVFVLLHGLLGDWFYYRSVRRLEARLAAMPDDAARAARIAQLQAPRRIEYVLVVLLLLPSTALTIVAADPQLRREWEGRPFVAVLEQDLRRLVQVQEEYFADVGRYAEAFGPWTYEPSPGVDLRILYADSLGFGAHAVFGGRSERCAVYLGPPRGMFTRAGPGTPDCKPPTLR